MIVPSGKSIRPYHSIIYVTEGMQIARPGNLIYKWLQSGVRCKVAPVERSKSGKSKAGRPQSGRENGKFNADYPKMALRTAARR